MRDFLVRRMFDDIAFSYDSQNSILSLGIDILWRKALADMIEPDTGLVLDAATGTGEVALTIRRRRPGLTVLGLDFSPAMLAVARKKIQRDGIPGYRLGVADCRVLPVADASVAAVTMAFGIRNIKPRSEAFAEMLRVLTPGGRACILEFGSGSERIWGGLYNFYLDRILPRIGKMVSRDPGAYEYLAETIRNFPTAPALEKEMTDAGFARAWHIKLTSGIVCLHVGEKAL